MDTVSSKGLSIKYIHDGLAASWLLSFGWVLALSEGTCFANCAGPGFGSITSSFRAKGHGMLLASLFTMHHLIFCNSTLSAMIEYISDNEALIKNVSYHYTQQQWNPNNTLDPDWDMLAEIVAMVQSSVPPPICSWVNSH